MRTSAVPLRKFLAQTAYNVKHRTLQATIPQLTFEPKSLLCFTTHGLIPQVVEQTTQLQQRWPELSVLIASMAHSRGVECSSELWLPDQFTVCGFKELEPLQSEQWNINETRLGLQFDQKKSVSLFPEGGYFEPTNSFSWISLSQGLHSPITYFEELDIEVPLGIKQLAHHHNLEPLHQGSYKITKSDGNVIFELNEKGACKILIDLLKNRPSEFDAYAKITHASGNCSVHHIIAGSPLYQGNGSPIVLHDADLSDATTAELLILDPSKAQCFGIKDRVVLETTDLERVKIMELEDDTVIQDHIVFGSENGFKIDGVMHSSLYETVQLDFVPGSESDGLQATH